MRLHDEKRYRGKRCTPEDIGRPSAAAFRAEGLCHIFKSFSNHYSCISAAIFVFGSMMSLMDMSPFSAAIR